MRIQFNTGRQYADEGQIIVVATQNDRAFFHDHTRNISGEIVTGPHGNEHDLRDAVMHAYDMGEYEPISVWHDSITVYRGESALKINGVNLTKVQS